MVFRCSPLFSFPVRFTPFSRGFDAIAFRLSPLEYLQGQTRLPAKVPARPLGPIGPIQTEQRSWVPSEKQELGSCVTTPGNNHQSVAGRSMVGTWDVLGPERTPAPNAVDRALLSAQDRGWIYYRTRRPVRGGSMYHLNELSEMLGGGNAPEIREEIQQAESSDPVTRDSE